MDVRGSNGQVWDVQVASGWRSRLAGLMGRTPRPLLIATSRVHSFWMRRPIRLVGVDQAGEVVEVRILARRRLARVNGARWILELPLEEPFPQPGDRLTPLPITPAFAHRSRRN
ncbi:MAG TPA: hypothetical protein VJ938_06150 [Acidimicrobiia bacterium]|nr:hypothetical protein [Acidimicrobiia bacterium]